MTLASIGIPIWYRVPPISIGRTEVPITMWDFSVTETSALVCVHRGNAGTAQSHHLLASRSASVLDFHLSPNGSRQSRLRLV